MRAERRRLRLLWDLAAPLLASQKPASQDGVPASGLERAVFNAVAYALLTGCPWRGMPSALGVAAADASQCFEGWTRAGLWQRLHRRACREPGAEAVGWTAALAAAAAVRAGGGAGDPDGSPLGSVEGREV
ncbi:hypothetical protein BIV57_04185 [Mangrovactinospora gilvigrisea]|uniref:Insertion element IS402-like domain-containing protein n=1 Tax=Mangrovactinospora gilvigrisea TaxID=1428644 RepID=A0A1J7BJJ5_9ACTN|nr:hypothetical protein BIV57_04185 [Mangrovactinospora gilvigrisea]